jgi:hypothetical protein
LWPSQITGTVGSNPGSSSFTLTELSPLFTGATPPVTTINVQVLMNSEMDDFNGSAALTTGMTVSVRGLLFNTPTTPTLVTRKIREDDHH